MSGKGYIVDTCSCTCIMLIIINFGALQYQVHVIIKGIQLLSNDKPKTAHMRTHSHTYMYNKGHEDNKYIIHVHVQCIQYQVILTPRLIESWEWTWGRVEANIK